MIITNLTRTSSFFFSVRKRLTFVIQTTCVDSAVRPEFSYGTHISLFVTLTFFLKQIPRIFQYSKCLQLAFHGVLHI